MNTRLLFVVLVQLCLLPWCQAAENEKAPNEKAPNEKASPRRVRIGVDLRLGLQSCIDYWQPIAEHLSENIPEYRFVIVPLASQQDLVRTMKTDGIDFMALGPALGLMAEDRFGAVPLATMVESSAGRKKFPSSDAACGGVVIRRADRSDIQTIQDVRGARVAAVKPWSLTGWIAEWGLFVKSGIDPQTDFKQVIFEGTDGAVVQSVLDGTADVGVLDATILSLMVKNKRIAVNSLHVIDRRGRAVPLASGSFITSTVRYPGRLVSKARTTSDALARRVADALIETTQQTHLDGMLLQVHWTPPCNYSKVRYLLQSLLGPEFAQTGGYPPPWERPAWLFPAAVILGAMVVLAVAFVLLRNHYSRREGELGEHLASTRGELTEARAEKQRLDAILSLAGCGIDIVDDNDQIVYADAEIERRYGPWRGKKCYEYFCDASSPCAGCCRPSPLDDLTPRVTEFNCQRGAFNGDPQAMTHCAEGESTRIIGVPFFDEGGRWLYARIHLPSMVFSELDTKAALR